MGKADKYSYGVVLDAGSSGTRAYVYRWLKNSKAREKASKTQLKSLPEVVTDEDWIKKVRPGVSSFGEKPEQIGPEHLKKLLTHALDHVPKDAVKDTPIFVLATAGMRLLPELQQKQLLSNMCTYIRSETKFLISDCDQHIRVISGDTEGLYGWIAANYLLGGFDAPEAHNHGKGHHTYGFLDMGGASAQIAFAPNATEAEKHANDLKLIRFRNIAGDVQEHRVFVTTWLGFGVNQAKQRYLKALAESYGPEGGAEIPDPCLPAGLLMSTDGNTLSKPPPRTKYFIGTGKFDECMKRTFPLLEKEKACVDEPCLINGVHVPGIDFDVNHFVGISEYWHTTHEIFEMGHKDKAYDFHTYQKKVKQFCEQDWSVIKDGIKAHTWGEKVSEQTAYEVCFKASWLINVLHDGIGIPRVGIEHTSSAHNGTKEIIEGAKEKGFLDPFQAVNKVKKNEISWTLGKMLLYASAAVPSLNTDSLPVGIGSNIKGVAVPSDFEYPGGGLLQGITPGGHSKTGSESSSIAGSIFRSDSSHRIPGFLFFLLIMIIAIFYLCGRERRSRIYTSYVHPHGKPGKGQRSQVSQFVHRILGRKPGSLSTMDFSGRDYDVEDGAATRLYDPSEFELGDMNNTSSSSDDDLPVSLSKKKTPTAGAVAGGGGGGSTTASSGYSSPTFNNKRPPRTVISHATSSVGGSGGGGGGGGNGLGGLGISGRLSPDIVLDRRGLALRTESREDLTGMTLGGRHSKSRSGSVSPTRLRNGNNTNG